MKKLLFMSLLMMLCAVSSHAAVSIIEQGGWFESAYVTWQKTAGLEYNVYVSPAASDTWTLLDDELVREYPSYGRADALGLKAGSYKFKVVPLIMATRSVVMPPSLMPLKSRLTTAQVLLTNKLETMVLVPITMMVP